MSFMVQHTKFFMITMQIFPFLSYIFACIMKHLILATYPFYIREKNNVSFHNEHMTIIRQIQIIDVKYIRNNIKTVIKQFSDL